MSRTIKDRPYWVVVKEAVDKGKIKHDSHFPRRYYTDNPYRSYTGKTFATYERKAIAAYVRKLKEEGIHYSVSKELRLERETDSRDYYQYYITFHLQKYRPYIEISSTCIEYGSDPRHARWSHCRPIIPENVTHKHKRCDCWYCIQNEKSRNNDDIGDADLLHVARCYSNGMELEEIEEIFNV